MGYFEMSLVGSDRASDLDAEIENAILTAAEKAVKMLRKQVGNFNESQWNTPGPVNVALILLESQRPYRKMLPDVTGYKELLDETWTMLVKLYKASEATDEAEWTFPKDKKEHLKQLHSIQTGILKLRTAYERKQKREDAN